MTTVGGRDASIERSGPGVGRALRYIGQGEMAWEEQPLIDTPAPYGAVLRPMAVARCDLDLAMVEQNLFPGPYTVGHEFVAEVTSVGEHVDLHAVGDLVLVPFQPSCGSCRQCARSMFAACQTFRAPAGAAYGFGAAGGSNGGAISDSLAISHADHLLIPAPRAVHVAALATLSDNVVDAYRAALPILNAGVGAEVLILGGFAPSIGLYAVAIALALGASRVRYADDDAHRCELAAGLGAEVEKIAVWPRRLDRAEVTIENTGSQEGLSCALRSTSDYGTCTTSAIHFAGSRELPMLEMYTRGVQLNVSRADSRKYLPAVVELVEKGLFDPMCVPTEVVYWEQAMTAWRSTAPKVVVVREI